MIKKECFEITAFAPASSANFFVGFDVLGFSVPLLGDEVTLQFNDTDKIQITSINDQSISTKLDENTAGYAVKLMCQELSIKQGFNIDIKKGIPLCSGLGGSAASAVAAVYALNQALEKPLSLEEIAKFAIEAESLASGQAHADNVVPSLWGGLTLVSQLKPLEVINLPSPDLYYVILHPEYKIPTANARKALSTQISLKVHVEQSARLAGLIASLYQKKFQHLGNYCKDTIIEPQRASLLPGFYEIQKSALDCAAICCSFSGAGPTLLALAESKSVVVQTAASMKAVAMQFFDKVRVWTGKFESSGTYIVGHKL